MRVNHYQHGQCEASDFIEHVLTLLEDVNPNTHWLIGNALKYAYRAGYKGDWHQDADKCADFIHKALTGYWLSGENDIKDEKEKLSHNNI